VLLPASTKEQSTLAKDDLRWKEKRILSKDLSEAEEKLFVGHIPDIEDVGVFHPIPVPSNFEAYDVEPTDGKISLSELIRVTKAEENVGDSFYAADTNGDGEISRTEFAAAPWWLEVDKGQPPSNAIEETPAVDVVAVEDKLLPNDQLSWNYILNGKLPSQSEQRSNAIEESSDPELLQQMDGRSEVRTDGKRMTVDLGDIFEDEDKVLMTEEDLQKLNLELAKLR